MCHQNEVLNKIKTRFPLKIMSNNPNIAALIDKQSFLNRQKWPCMLDIVCEWLTVAVYVTIILDYTTVHKRGRPLLNNL